MITDTQARILLDSSRLRPLTISSEIQDLYIKSQKKFLKRLDELLLDKFDGNDINWIQKSIRKSFKLSILTRAGFTPRIIYDVYNKKISSDTVHAAVARYAVMVNTPEGRKSLRPLEKEFMESFSKKYKKSDRKITKAQARLICIKCRPKPFVIDEEFQRAYLNNHNKFFNKLNSFLLEKFGVKKGACQVLSKVVGLGFLTKTGLSQQLILKYGGSVCSSYSTIRLAYRRYSKIVTMVAGKQLILPLEREFLDFIYED